jgi:hypothetical protein
MPSQVEATLVTYLGQSHYMKLMNVLHIPTNRNNLLSLGRLDSAGGSYRSTNRKLILCSADHTPIAEGYKVSNNLYKMHVKVYKDTPNTTTPKVGHVYKAKDAAMNWELWHKHYGHISYSGLKRLHNEKMVDGFTVDINSPMPDCAACTEAKQHTKPFNKAEKCELKPGELCSVCHAHFPGVGDVGGNQSGHGKEMLSRGTFEREGTRVTLQQVTIEEHQVRDLVFALL